jgi:tRNA U34 5-carboxymethylaminomethyl modifying enzyme MnmG/GidA
MYARYLGMKRFPAGRMGDTPARGLSESLARAGFKLGRLQTGTPARLDARTVNLEGMEVQKGDADPSPFSFLNANVANKVSYSVYVHWSGSLISGRKIKWHATKPTQRLRPTDWFAKVCT